MPRANAAAAAWKWPLGLIALFAGLAWWMTAPLGWNLGRVLVYYGSPGDAMFGIVNVWMHQQAWVAPHQSLIAPAWMWGLEPMLEVCLLALSVAMHEVFAYNLLLWLSFPMAGLSMYLLCRSLTGDRAASVVAGVAYAFCPYHFAHTTQLSLASIQWLPLIPWSLWRWVERPSRGRWLACAGLAVWAGSWNPHYGLFTFLLLGVLGAGLAWPDPARRRGWLGLLGVTGAAGLAVLWSGLRPGGVHPLTLTWGLKDLFVYSAKPWDYLAPSPYHPWWGDAVAPFVRSHWYGSNVVEQTLFLGYGVIALAVVGLFRGARTPQEARVIRWMAGASVIALLCSAPPFVPLGSFQIINNTVVAPAKVYFPSFLLQHLLPWLRVYARFGLVVMLAAAVLAAFGVRALLEPIRRVWVHRAIAWGLGGVILIEFLPGLQVRDVSRVPPVYAWLAQEPGGGTVVEYPWRGIDTDVHAEYMFWSRLHRKPLLNDGPLPDRAWADPGSPAVRRQLAAAGVRYIIVHPAWYARPISAAPAVISLFGVTYHVPNRHAWEPRTPPTLTLQNGWELIGRFDDATLYQVAIGY
ncbi:MAG: hypothetical protein HY600_02100 [Candidatus Omnitrophica bacterium]|nr:hypothetical protein [Candidatus Omnitrophota bacterium]